VEKIGETGLTRNVQSKLASAICQLRLNVRSTIYVVANFLVALAEIFSRYNAQNRG
jgi:hypothetical protein